MLYSGGTDPATGHPLTGYWGQLRFLPHSFVDLTTPQPVEETFAVLAGLVDRLEKLFPA